MFKFYSSPVRAGVAEVLQCVKSDLLIASPYIKTIEANWVCEELIKNKVQTTVKLQILTDLRSENVLNGSLDIQALKVFSDTFQHAIIINLPRIHAKVYIADTKFALVTSANLTPSGMENNFEYGVGFSEPSTVRNVRRDLQAYAQLGNIISTATISELIQVAEDISAEFRKLQRQAGSQLRNRFSEKLRAANHEFLRAQVGNRSAHSLFADAILYLLSFGPLSTKELHPRIQKLLPDLCNDSTELIINGQRFGKKWKHVFRNAQVFLRRAGKIFFNGSVWALK